MQRGLAQFRRAMVVNDTCSCTRDNHVRDVPLVRRSLPLGAHLATFLPCPSRHVSVVGFQVLRLPTSTTALVVDVCDALLVVVVVVDC